ncbi:dATP/dGTP pyrophosphohydrolase domain-containing protein [Achromobacter xylosoxidans]|uniref:dATP/dGTP pyrophosphohydrolase domain-containing protein n=1 Tax=Alcaligenes xylosoxydans xylosoxydans TaxID=85698 RepID=UPI001F0EA073|nr:dATP/dGTP pyrophosphohydrolase domain-containing protein [Achromobacter xylosoxidans]MCH4581715.1 DUF550 domain-containing protein [Achromobacter xylosoxidans]
MKENNAAQAATQHPIDEAIVILTEEAAALSDCHTRPIGDWTGEDEAKARYDYIQTVIAALSKLRAPVADERAQNIHSLISRFRNATRDDAKNGGRDYFDAAKALESELRRAVDVLASAPVAGEAQPVCWIEKDVLESVRDEGSDAWVYWRPAGHVAEHDEMPLYAAPQASAEAFAKLQSAYIGACDQIERLLAEKQASAENAPVTGEAFMYGIMGPDGKAHFEEFCVSGDRTELQTEVVDHLNRDNPEDGTYSVVALFRDAAPQASAEAFDFVAHLARQAEFSARTFGPGARVAGVCDHIRKELIEVETSGGDLKEWVDVIILGLDGAWRSGATPQEIIAAIVAKQAKNEARTWPDWRTMDPNKAIEHQRTAAPCSRPSGDGSLRHPCAAHPAKASGNGGEQWSDS